jgi:hypothetical protein
VIVIAAAGNKVPGGRVVFPAAFETPIAMAATNYNNVPWKCSSRAGASRFRRPENRSGRRAAPRGTVACRPAPERRSRPRRWRALRRLWLSYPDGEHQRQLSRLDEGETRFHAHFATSWLAPLVRRQAGILLTTVPGLWTAVKVNRSGSVLRFQARAAKPFAKDWCPTNPDAFVGIRGIFSDASNGRERVRALFKTNDLCRVAVVADEFVLLSTVDPAVATAIVRISGPDEPRSADYEAVRRAVRNADASDRLRSMMWIGRLSPPRLRHSRHAKFVRARRIAPHHDNTCFAVAGTVSEQDSAGPSDTAAGRTRSDSGAMFEPDIQIGIAGAVHHHVEVTARCHGKRPVSPSARSSRLIAWRMSPSSAVPSRARESPWRTGL